MYLDFESYFASVITTNSALRGKSSNRQCINAQCVCVPINFIYKQWPLQKWQLIISNSFLDCSLHVMLAVTTLTRELGLGWNILKSITHMSGASTGALETAGAFLSFLSTCVSYHSAVQLPLITWKLGRSQERRSRSFHDTLCPDRELAKSYVVKASNRDRQPELTGKRHRSYILLGRIACNHRNGGFGAGHLLQGTYHSTYHLHHIMHCQVTVCAEVLDHGSLWSNWKRKRYHWVYGKKNPSL